MSAGDARVVSWFVRHRRKGDTNAEATVVKVQAVTPAEAIARVRPTLPEGHVMTSVAAY